MMSMAEATRTIAFKVRRRPCMRLPLCMRGPHCRAQALHARPADLRNGQ
jgi:hypothetical protein